MRKLLYCCSVFTAISLLLTTGCVSAGTGASGKEYAVHAGTAAANADFELYEKGEKLPAAFPATAFAVSYDENGFKITLTLDEPDPKQPSTLELFFAPRAGDGDLHYYQYFGLTDLPHNIQLYCRGKFSAEYPYLKHQNVENTLKDGKRVVTLSFAWSDFQYALPFDGAPVWRFNLVRWYKDAGAAWQGTLHKPETWGTLVWSRFGKDLQAAVLRNILKYNAAVMPDFDPQTCSRAGYDAAVRQYKAVCARIAANPDALSVGELRKAVRELRDLRAFCITRSSDLSASHLSAARLEKGEGPFWMAFINGERKKTTWWILVRPNLKKDTCHAEHILQSDPQGELWLTDCVANHPKKTPNHVTVTAKDKMLAEFDVTATPQNIRLDPKRTAGLKKGDVIRMTFTGGDALNSNLFRLREYRCGAQPAPAKIPGKAAPYESLPIADGEWYSTHRNRQEEMLVRSPKLLMLGDSITDFFRGPAWDQLKKFNPVNMGYSGDRTQHLLWRVEHSNIAKAKPLAAVILIGTNNVWDKPEDVAKGIKAIIDSLQRQSPGTKILLLGLFPRASDNPKQNARVNEIISKFGDEKRIFYRDYSAIWVDKDGKVRKDLMPDSLHPNQKGYFE